MVSVGAVAASSPAAVALGDDAAAGARAAGDDKNDDIVGLANAIAATEARGPGSGELRRAPFEAAGLYHASGCSAGSPLAEINRGGTLDFKDWLAFINGSVACTPRADLNKDGGCDFFNGLLFLDA